MARRTLIGILAGAVLVSGAMACGNGSSTADPGLVAGDDGLVPSDPGVAPADVPPEGGADVPADAPSDLLSETTPDLPPEATPDLPPEATPDVPEDVPALDAGDLPGETGPDVPAEFPWASGCEGTAARTAWTPIHDATFPRGPLVQMSDRDTVTLVWRTATPTAAEGCAEYAGGGVKGTACGLADANGQYEVALTGLPAATEFTYHVRVGDTRTADLTFRTMPERPVAMKFAVFADAHNQEENLRKMSALALAEGVDFAVGVGDLAGAGLPEEYDQTLRGLQDLGSRVNVWTVLGNHDEKNLQGYFDAFVMPQGNEEEASSGVGEGWWARRIGDVWLGGGWVRDFYLSMPDTDWGQVGWFRRQFESQAYKTAKWKLFFIHQPPWVREWGECGYTGEECLKVALAPLAASAGIQAMFHGHMHGIEYGQVQGVWSFIAGGVGGTGMDDGVCPTPEGFPQPWYSLYGVPNFVVVEAGCDGLTVRFLDLDGKEVARQEVPASAEPPAGPAR